MNTKTQEGATNKGNPYFLRVPWIKGGFCLGCLGDPGVSPSLVVSSLVGCLGDPGVSPSLVVSSLVGCLGDPGVSPSLVIWSLVGCLGDLGVSPSLVVWSLVARLMLHKFYITIT